MNSGNLTSRLDEMSDASGVFLAVFSISQVRGNRWYLNLTKINFWVLARAN